MFGGAGVSLTGCTGAPSQAILGSYFPSWMLCAIAGMIFAIFVKQSLALIGIDKLLPVPPLVYAAVAVASTFAFWLVWLG